MKALGSGHRGRSRCATWRWCGPPGTAPTRGRPRSGWPPGPPSWRAAAGSRAGTSRSPTPPAWPWPWWWPRADRAERAAGGHGGRGPGGRRGGPGPGEPGHPGVAGRHGGGPLVPAAARLGPTAAGWWWWPARATTGPTAGWPPPSCARRGARVTMVDAGSAPDRPAPLRPGARRRLRHRLPGQLRGAEGADRRRGAGGGHPLGGRRRHRRGRGAAHGGRPHRHLRRLQAGAAAGGRAGAGRRGGGGRHRGAGRGRPASAWSRTPTSPALVPRRARESHKWASAVAVVAGSPGHGGGGGRWRPGGPPTPVRAWCAWPCPGSAEAAAAGTWPVEAVRLALPAEGWADEVLAALDRCRALVVGPGLGRAEATRRPRSASWWRRSPVPVVADADALVRPGRSAARAWSPGGRAVVLTPHDGEYARLAGRATRARPGGRGPAAGRPDRGGGAAEGLAHRGGRPDGRPGPAGRGRQPAPGHGGHRRRAVGSDRGAARPRGPAGRGGRARRPRPRPGRRPGPAEGLVAADLPAAGVACLACPAPAAAIGPTVAEGRSRPAWAEVDLGAVAHNAAVLRPPRRTPAALCAVVKADGYGHGAVAGGPRRARGRGRLAGRGPGRRGGRAAPGGRDRPGPAPLRAAGRRRRRVVAHGLTPTVARPRAAGGRWPRRPAGGAAAARVHVKVDTGMHRVGVAPEGAVALVVGGGRRAGPRGRGAVDPPGGGRRRVDEADREFTALQLRRFADGGRRLVAAAGPRPVVLPRRQLGRRHLLPLGPPRPGALRHRPLRGGRPRRWWRPTWPPPAAGPLRPALSLRLGGRGRAPARRPASAPPTAGSRPLPVDSVVATVPLGYADGVPRALFDGGLLGPDRRPPPAAGRHGDHGPARRRLRPRRRRWRRATRWCSSAARATRRSPPPSGPGSLGTIAYEVLCGIGARVPRVPVPAGRRSPGGGTGRPGAGRGTLAGEVAR